MGTAFSNFISTMHQCMDLFCKLFGEIINNKKFELISKNCSPQIPKLVKDTFNIDTSPDFGKYLGYPILNKNPTPRDFNFIPDSMATKLAN